MFLQVASHVVRTHVYEIRSVLIYGELRENLPRNFLNALCMVAFYNILKSLTFTNRYFV